MLLREAQWLWPWALLLLGAIPLLAWLRSKGRRPAFLFIRAAFVPSTRRQRYGYLPWAARGLALGLVIVAMAQPEWGAKREFLSRRGIGIEIVIDRSGSMTTVLDAAQNRTRLDAVKQATEQFIFGGGHGLEGRPNDSIGLMEFAADPVTLSPLTLAHEQLRPLIESIRPARGQDDGTAIGDAIAVASARFRLAERNGVLLKTKVVLLLTDGENNMGARSPAQAADLAKQWGVRIYALGMRSKEYQAAGSQYQPTARTGTEAALSDFMTAGLDVLTLQTGGMWRTATESGALRDFYNEIDRLEPSDLSGVIRRPGQRYLGLMLGAAMALLTAAVALDETALRRIP